MTTILILKDDADLRKELVEWLKNRGYDTVSATNGKEALERFEAGARPDLMVCDTLMPVMDGKQFLSDYSTNQKDKITPYIGISAIAERKHIRACMGIGVDDYLTKPFSYDEFMHTIKSVFRKHGHIEDNIRKNLMKQEIMTFLPHELRTPLTSIIGFGNIIADRAEFFNTEEIKDIGNKIAKAGQAMHSLTEKFLLYIQLERIKNDNGKFISKRILESVIYEESVNIGLKYNQAERLGHSVQPVSLQLPENYLRILVKELVDNCFRFSDENTDITINGELRDNYFVLSFNNRGRGMTPDQIKNIGAFRQFERDQYKKQGGGLGLIIVKRICDNSGGKLSISSKPGELTSVQCFFPVAKEIENMP